MPLPAARRTMLTEVRMKLPTACLVSVLLFCVAVPAAAQTAKPGARETARDRAVKRCKENRGTDCTTAAGLKEWLRQERPVTVEERRAAAAARRQREQCAKTKSGSGC